MLHKPIAFLIIIIIIKKKKKKKKPIAMRLSKEIVAIYGIYCNENLVLHKITPIPKIRRRRT